MAVARSELRVENSTLKIDSQFKRYYTHEYLIESNNPDDTQLDIYNGMFSASPDPVPQLWSQYSSGSNFDGWAYLQNIDVKRLEDRPDNRLFWLVTCQWSPPPEGEDPAQQSENPLSRPVKYSMEWANYTRIVERDKDGNAIINYADDAFDPPLEMDDARPVLTAVKNIWPLESIIALAIYFKNAVNTDTFFGAAARTAKIENIVSGSLLHENSIDYYQVIFRVQFNEETWDRRVMERGSHAFPTAKTGTPTPQKRRVRVLSGTNQGELLDFALLNSDGTQKADGLDPEFTSWRIYPERAFTAGGPFGDGLGIGGA